MAVQCWPLYILPFIVELAAIKGGGCRPKLQHFLVQNEKEIATACILVLQARLVQTDKVCKEEFYVFKTFMISSTVYVQ